MSFSDLWTPVFLVERLNEVEQSQVEFWLTVTGLSVVVLIVLLMVFTVSLRAIAMKRTAPCRWCMEFIPKSAATCPRCGKRSASDNALEVTLKARSADDPIKSR
ncbi:MAG TPA: hypothetical protein VEJ63_04660 [Planctomycetota bacterium]|nr:hypothetical protein [Planctomycetota bacterium]